MKLVEPSSLGRLIRAVRCIPPPSLQTEKDKVITLYFARSRTFALPFSKGVIRLRPGDLTLAFQIDRPVDGGYGDPCGCSRKNADADSIKADAVAPAGVRSAVANAK